MRGMAEGNRRQASDNDHNLEALWTVHVNLAQKYEKLTNEFVRFVGDIKREIVGLKYTSLGKKRSTGKHT